MAQQTATSLIGLSPKIPELDQIPKEIRANSSNLEVQFFLFDQLLKYNYNLGEIVTTKYMAP